MLVIVAPGQGAQAPGFLSPWLELPGLADCLTAWSELAGCDLIWAGTTAGAAEITDTAVAQPLLVAAALAAASELFGELGGAPRLAQVAAGHSVGELAAGAIAGVIAPDGAMRLVGARGRAMAEAAAVSATGMTAVLGGSEPEVLAAIEAAGLTPANINGAGQVVAAGTREQLDAFAASPPPGARLRPLAVAGAFHTHHMAPAVDALRAAAAGVGVSDPGMVLLSNADGEPVRSGADWLERIITQVSAPVRWDACIRSMAALGASALVELPPGGTLTGLARRQLPGLATAALQTPGDLGAARALLAEHGERGGVGPQQDAPAARGGAEPQQDQQDAHAPDWRLLVSPLAGTFRAGAGGDAASPGASVHAGSPLGLIEERRGQHEITPSFPATILEWLVEDGDPVNAGQPLVRLQPEGTAS